MSILKVKVVTPHKVVYSGEAISITLPSAEGEITVLPHHIPLFSVLEEGVLIIRESRGGERYYAIGGGYLETDGEEATILVSRAFGQKDIDEKLTAKALEEAKKVLERSKDIKERKRAEQVLRRSTLDLKLLSKLRRKKRS